MILTCGESLIDMLPGKDADGNEAFLPRVGGSPFNTAIAAARLGVPTAYLGRVSRDFFGDLIVERLIENGVDRRFIVRADDPTTLAFVRRLAGGDARYAFFTQNTADRKISRSDLPDNLPDDVRCIAYGSISLALEPGASTIHDFVARERGRRVLSFDPNVRPSMIADRDAYVSLVTELAETSTIVKVSDADLEWLFPDAEFDLVTAARRFLRPGSLVVVTRGADGAIAVTDRYTVEQPAVAADVVDTIGAGDSFHAAILAWLETHGRLAIDTIAALSADDARSALIFAARVAALTCSRAGAEPPTIAEYERDASSPRRRRNER